MSSLCFEFVGPQGDEDVILVPQDDESRGVWSVIADGYNSVIGEIRAIHLHADRALYYGIFRDGYETHARNCLRDVAHDLFELSL